MVNFNLSIDLSTVEMVDEYRGMTIEQIIVQEAIGKISSELSSMLRDNSMRKEVHTRIDEAAKLYFEHQLKPLVDEAIDSALEAVFGSRDHDEIREHIAGRAEQVARGAVGAALQEMSLDIRGRR
jgi:hypothetical protein